MVKSGEKATQPGTLIKKLITKRQNLGGARVESRNKNHKPDTKSENRIPVPTCGGNKENSSSSRTQAATELTRSEDFQQKS
jgi:hypothetical protein